MWGQETVFHKLILWAEFLPSFKPPTQLFLFQFMAGFLTVWSLAAVWYICLIKPLTFDLSSFCPRWSRCSSKLTALWRSWHNSENSAEKELRYHLQGWTPSRYFTNYKLPEVMNSQARYRKTVWCFIALTSPPSANRSGPGGGPESGNYSDPNSPPDISPDISAAFALWLEYTWISSASMQCLSVTELNL